MDEHKTVLWGGPSDGKEVVVEPGQMQYFEGQPGLTMSLGRYQWSALSRRFEWMGYE